MEYEEIGPPAELAGLVRCFWTLRGAAPEPDPVPAEPAFPDGSPELILNFADPFAHVAPGRRAVRQPAAFLVGQITRPMHVSPTGRIDLLAVRFESHGAAILSRPLRALTDRWMALSRLAGRPLLPAVTDVLATHDPAQRLARLTEGLCERAATAKPPDARVAHVVREIRRTHGAAPLAALLREVRLTPRSLQRLFAGEVGIGPKLLARIVRFQRVFAAWRSAPSSLSRVAAECGYYDQPHLVRDFREFAGEAPARLLADTPEFTAFFTA